MTVSAGMLTVIMFGAIFVLMVTGLPIAYSVGAAGMAAALLLWGPQALYITYFGTSSITSSFVLLALPLFIFMGCILQGANFAEDLFHCAYNLLGGIPGGLAVGCVLICLLIAAMVGVSSAATISLGIMAIPPMMARGYDKKLITGTIQAGGALGFLIPPSVSMVSYAFVSGTSLARLFAGGVFPGLMLAIMYIIYILIRCRIQPKLGPPIPKAERATGKEKASSLRGIIIPLCLIFLVLGTIFFGICSPTEAAAVGCLGSLVCAYFKKRLTKKIIWTAMTTTLKLVGMVAWIVVAATCFSKVYNALGASKMIQAFIGNAGINSWVVLICIQLSFFILGMFLDDGAILFVCMPVYIPIVQMLGFDTVWFAILYIVNMQCAFLTPPFGYNLFYIRSVAPPEITLKDIYISVLPYIALQILGLIIIMIFPQIVTWLPTKMFG